MTVTVREAVHDDWVDAGRICYEAFASLADEHGFPHDFPTVAAASDPIRWMIDHPDITGLVAESEGRVVGSLFMDRRGPIWAIGPISVDPNVQDRGVGRLLTQTAVDMWRAGDSPGLRLVQIAYHNRSISLYTRLGFDARETLAAMHGSPIRREMPGYAVRPATAADAEACDTLCLRVHGHTRPGEVREAIESGDARVVEHLGRITGYTTRINYFFHSVAETNDDMRALICAADDYGTPGFLVPIANHDLFRWCLENGLRVFFLTNLMSIGMYNEPEGTWLPSVGY